MTIDTLRAVSDEFGPHSTNWVQVAICLYAFDEVTAQRLAFVRWLRTTGRLRGDDAAAPELASVRAWMSG